MCWNEGRALIPQLIACVDNALKCNNICQGDRCWVCWVEEAIANLFERSHHYDYQIGGLVRSLLGVVDKGRSTINALESSNLYQGDRQLIVCSHRLLLGLKEKHA